MTKHSRRHRRMAGGYSSASTYGMHVSGDANSQYNRVFGPEYSNVQGNVIIGAQGQNITPASQMPTAANLAAAQSAGKRRGRGGFLGEVVNQAVVPLSLLGMQQTYRRKKGGKMIPTSQFAGKTRRRGGFLGEVVNQAVVPMAVLGMQQTYGRKKRGGNQTRRRNRH